MQVFYNENHHLHDPSFYLVRGQPQASAEQPKRASVLRSACAEAGHELIATSGAADAAIEAVHSQDYLAFLKEAPALWSMLPGSAQEVVPNVHPNRQRSIYPRAIVGRAGWHQADTACPIGTGTYDAARGAAVAAVTGARALLEGEDFCYALCRPPGHHAYADMAGGFCFLNNSAIAAEYLRSHHERVAVLDVDVHHGNGTQGIFYERDDVLTVSLHADPRDYYPFFWGHAEELGSGAGEGFNRNWPLPLGTRDAEYLRELDHALSVIVDFAPGALVVALGLDAYEGDPLKGLGITTSGFSQIAAVIARLGIPTLLVQEGGYLSPELGTNLISFLDGFGAAR